MGNNDLKDFTNFARTTEGITALTNFSMLVFRYWKLEYYTEDNSEDYEKYINDIVKYLLTLDEDNIINQYIKSDECITFLNYIVAENIETYLISCL